MHRRCLLFFIVAWKLSRVNFTQLSNSNHVIGNTVCIKNEYARISIQHSSETVVLSFQHCGSGFQPSFFLPYISLNSHLAKCYLYLLRSPLRSEMPPLTAIPCQKFATGKQEFLFHLLPKMKRNLHCYNILCIQKMAALYFFETKIVHFIQLHPHFFLHIVWFG